MSFIDFDKLTVAQQIEARAMRLKWPFPEEFLRFSFWIKPDGHLSRRAGHHQLTAAAGAEIDAELRRCGAAARSKTDLDDWKPGTKFSTSLS